MARTKIVLDLQSDLVLTGASASGGTFSGIELVNPTGLVQADISGLTSSLLNLTSADTSLTTRVSTEESTRASVDASIQSNVNTVAGDLASAEGSLNTRVSTEESARASADTSLTARVSNEESTRASADTSIVNAYTSADTSLSSRISTESARVDAILSGADVNLDQFVELVSFINSVDSVNDGALSTQIASIGTSIDAIVSTEGSVRASADTSLTARVSDEESTRASADTSLTARVSNEESTRASADTSLETRVSDEESARASADSSLSSALTTAISNEESARSSADTSLTTRVSTEESVRASADDSIVANGYKFYGPVTSTNDGTDYVISNAQFDNQNSDILVFVNGLLQIEGVGNDYTASYSSPDMTFTFVQSNKPDDKVVVYARLGTFA